MLTRRAMRFLLLPLVFLSACGPDAPCRSLVLGQPLGDLPRDRIDRYGGRTDYTSRLGGSSNPDGDFDLGPVEAHLCCHSQRVSQPLSWCSAEQFECSAPQFQGVELYSLRYPYHADHGFDAGRFCTVAVKDGVLVAIWARWWS